MTTDALHPTETELVEFALTEADSRVESHVTQCSSCARYVGEIRAVEQGLRDVPDEDVPARVRERILSGKSRRAWRALPGLWGGPAQWYRHPALIALGVAFAAVFFYWLLAVLL